MLDGNRNLEARACGPYPRPAHRRKWELAPLCGAGTTFSGSSEDPSRPRNEEGRKVECL